MFRMKKILKEYFTFSKKERIAMSILLVLIAFFIAVPYFYPLKDAEPVKNEALDAYFRQQPQHAAAAEAPGFNRDGNILPKRHEPESFHFNPNTATPDEWKRLGLSDRTVHTISNYLSKGGRFRTASDLHKVWGIRPEDATRLAAWAVIPQQAAPADSRKVPEDSMRNHSVAYKPVPAYEKAAQSPTVIDINIAGEDEWAALPGLWKGLAARIVHYRSKIGGFVSVDQVKTTYGITDSIFALMKPWLRLDPASLPRLDLNALAAWEFQKRLQLSAAVARTLVAYRDKYGPFVSVEDLKKLAFLPDSTSRRISQRLKTGEKN